MDLILFYLRKLFTVLRNEVLVLPSRVVAVLFFLFLLLLPVFTKDAYLLRIFTLTSIFAILGCELGSAFRLHRPDEFRTCPLLWRGSLRFSCAQ